MTTVLSGIMIYDAMVMRLFQNLRLNLEASQIIETFPVVERGGMEILQAGNKLDTPETDSSKFTKLRGNQGWKDKLHKDHWDICNSKGNSDS